MPEAEHAEVRQWLDQHGLTDTEPTPLLAARLAVRRRAKIIDSLLLARSSWAGRQCSAARMPSSRS